MFQTYLFHPFLVFPLHLFDELILVLCLRLIHDLLDAKKTVAIVCVRAVADLEGKPKNVNAARNSKTSWKLRKKLMPHATWNL